MKRCFFLIGLLFVIGVSSTASRAYATGFCCQLSSGAQESLLGTQAPGGGRVSLQLSYSYTLMDKFKEGEASRSLAGIESQGKYTIIPTRMGMTRYTLTAGYGVTPRLKLFVSIPYVRNTMDMQMFMDMGMGPQWMEHHMDPLDGLGDITVLALYRVYQDSDIRPTGILAAGAGLKTTTGEYRQRGSNGRFIHAHMQPGTGSWDPILALSYTKLSRKFLLQGDASYEIATRNSEGYAFGSSITADLTGKYSAGELLNLVGGVVFLHQSRSSDSKGRYTNPASLIDDPANTGGDSLWLSPGLEILPLKNTVLGAKVQVPVWERVNGVQLVASYRLLFSATYGF